MSSSIERKLLAKMTDLVEMNRVRELGLRQDLFEDPIHRFAFVFMVEHWEGADRQVAPSRLVMETEYPQVQLDDNVEETTDWLVERLQKRYARNQLQSVIRDVLTKGQTNDPIRALRTLAREAKNALEGVGGAGKGYETEYLRADQLDILPAPEPLVADVLQRHTYAILRGRDGSFKSFIALDWALSLCSGMPWQGREVEQVKVLYVAGEGAYGIAERKRAWEAKHGLVIDPNWFVVRKSAVNLFRGGADFDHLLDFVEDNKFGLVVFDTLRRMSSGAEGNGSDMGVVVDNLDAVKRHTADGSVLVIAHTDKGDHDTRGFSGIEDDADTVWSVKRDGTTNEVTLTCIKMKDGPDGHRFELSLRSQSGSLVVDTRAQSQGRLLSEDRHSDQLVMAEMRETFSETGATVPDLERMTGQSRATLYRSRARLLGTGQLRAEKSRLFLNSDEGNPDE